MTTVWPHHLGGDSVARAQRLNGKNAPTHRNGPVRGSGQRRASKHDSGWSSGAASGANRLLGSMTLHLYTAFFRRVTLWLQLHARKKAERAWPSGFVAPTRNPTEGISLLRRRSRVRLAQLVLFLPRRAPRRQVPAAQLRRSATGRAVADPAQTLRAGSAVASRRSSPRSAGEGTRRRQLAQTL